MGTVRDKNSTAVRKQIEKHAFDDEEGEEYEASKFNGFSDYMRRKKLKLQNLDAQTRAASDKPKIFKGIVCHVTGYTQPPLHILHKEIVEHGGGFLQYLTGKTMATHIIASSLPPKKSVEFDRYRIVKPGWIMDSVTAGRVLPWSDYKVLDEGPRQKVLKFDTGQGLTQSSPNAKQGYKEQTDNSFYDRQLRAPALPSQSFSQMVETIGEASPLAPRSHHAAVEGPQEQTTRDQPPVSESHAGTVTPTKEMLEELPGDVAVDNAEKKPTEDPPVEDRFKNMTSEEHNAWLLSDPRLRKSSSANPDFIKQYYSESRLHHLSTWKAELKSRMQKLAAEKGLGRKRGKRRPGTRRYILHVDFDSFFCAISLKKYPQYVDIPTVVAHSNGPGSEIASCNYPARKFGVKNGMWMKSALDMCPDLKVVPYDFPAYEDASRLFYESILDLGAIVQSVSIDEALVDATSIVLDSTGSQGIGVEEGSIWREQAKVDEMAQTLRDTVKERTGCAVSVGIGGNILLAKVALRRAKPAGQYQLKPDDVLDVIGELKVESLPGVAYSISGKFEEIGVRLVKDIRDVSRERLVQLLGPKTSEKLREYSRGIDNTEVGDQPPRKSVSAEVNWGIRFLNQPEAEEFIFNLCKEVQRRLLNENVKGRQMTMKIMRRSQDAPLDPAKHLGHGKCDTFNKSSSFGVATNDWETIGKEAVSILRSFRFSPGDLRGLGVQMTKLEQIKAKSGASEGSQRKLTFGSPAGTLPARKPSHPEPIDEDVNAAMSVSRSTSGVELIDDDPMTPRKPKIHPAIAIAKAGEQDARATTPLNVSGTQFIIPSNADPAILDDLPVDIRSRLMGQRQKGILPGTESPLARSRSGSPMVPDLLPSQVDAEVFNALPDEMKEELLAQYKRRPAPDSSPHKDRLAQSRKQTTPTKTGAPGLFAQGERQKDTAAGLMQTNFTSSRPSDIGDAFDEDAAEELDPEILAQIPEEMRREVMADHRRRRLAQKSRLDAPARKPQDRDPDEPLPGGQKRIQFGPPPPKISFASGVTSTREIKDMLDAWHSETKRDGPHRGDVEVFEKYLVKVVNEERDLEKVVKLIKWLEIIVDQGDKQGRGLRTWTMSIASIKSAVQDAVRGRGLAPLKL